MPEGHLAQQCLPAIPPRRPTAYLDALLSGSGGTAVVQHIDEVSSSWGSRQRLAELLPDDDLVTQGG